MSSKLLLFVLVSALVSWSGPGFALALQEAGWAIEYEIDFTRAQAARLNPKDGKIYVARFATPGNDGGIFRIDDATDPMNPVVTKLEGVDRPRGLAIDPVSGDIFYSNGGDGSIGRVPYDPLETPGTWASGFHGGLDSDPVGLAIAPLDYSGDVLPMSAGQGLFADEGTGSGPPTEHPEEIWRWNSTDGNDWGLILPDDGSVLKPVDVAIGSDSIYLADQGFFDFTPSDPGALLRLDFDAGMGMAFVTEVDLEDAAANPIDLASPMAVAVDPFTGDVLVADAFEDTIYRVSVVEDPGTGALTGTTTVFASGFDFGDNATGPIEASSLGFSSLGDRLIVSERNTGKIYVLSAVPEPRVVALVGLGLVALGRARRRPRGAWRRGGPASAQVGGVDAG